MRALIIIALALIASGPAFAGDDQDEDVSGVRVGNQMIWSDGTVSPISRDDDSLNANSQYSHKTYDDDDHSSHQSSPYTFHNGRACVVIGGVANCN
jgi:hypothetical protein